MRYEDGPVERYTVYFDLDRGTLTKILLTFVRLIWKRSEEGRLRQLHLCTHLFLFRDDDWEKKKSKNGGRGRDLLETVKDESGDLENIHWVKNDVLLL